MGRPARRVGVPAFKLKPVRLGAEPEESIFAKPEAKEAAPGWKHLKEGELPPAAEEATVFERSSTAKPESSAVSKPFSIPEPPPPPSLPKSDALHVAPPLAHSPVTDHAEKRRLPPVHKGEGEASSLVKAPALADPVRQLAPPFPAGAIRKEVPVAPPPSTPAVPPPLPGLVSALKKTGPVPDKPSPPPEAKEEIALKSSPENFPAASPIIPSAVLKEETKTELPAVDAKSAAIPLTQAELPIASAKAAALPPALPKIDAVEKKTDPAKIIETVAPSFTSRKNEPAALLDPTIRSKPQVTEPPPPVGAAGAKSFSGKSKIPVSSAAPETPGPPPVSRAARLHKRRLISTITFYVVFLGLLVPTLFFLGLHFSSETRVEGQVIPPPGTLLNNEVWIVSDFRELASGIADDLAAARAPQLQEIQERQDHVQRAQADIAAREERIRLLQEQIQAARDEIATAIKQAHDASQKVWDGPGAALEDEYKTKLTQLQDLIAARAKSLNLKYTPDDTYQSPEVWANAYRLALYETPPGVDGTKEHQWIEDQIKAWRAFTKSYDDRKEKLRQQAAQIQVAPSSQVTDVNGRIDDLQHRVDSTEAEEEPLKTELQQAQADLVTAQTAEADLDGKYYQELYSLAQSVAKIKTLPVESNGRFTWSHLEKDSALSGNEKDHNFWIFAIAVRKDGLQYWVLTHFSVQQNSVLPILIEPSSFVSTKAILRPDLPADQQQ